MRRIYECGGLPCQASISRHPAMNLAWLAIMPIDLPPTLAKPVTMLRATFPELREISVVNDLFDDIADVISLVGGVCPWDHLTKSRIHSRRIITCFYEWRFFHVVAGQIAEHFSCLSVASASSFAKKCAQPEVPPLWALAPPICSEVTSSPVTALIT